MILSIPTFLPSFDVLWRSFRTSVLLGLLLLLGNLARLPAQDSQDVSVELFNGRDLSGWVLVNTPQDTWSVQDGMIVCTGKPIGEIRTSEMFQNFELELEWRHMVPRGNAGIFVWADDITARGVPFHRSIEVQVLEDACGNTQSHTVHGDIFPIHGAKMNPINGRGGSRAFPTEFRCKPSPEWNHYRIVCNDGNISLAVNGKVVTQGTNAEPRKGYICLESEGGVVHYRNFKMRRLPDTTIDPGQVAIANRGYRSVYSGLDLRDWKASEKAKSSWQPKDWILHFDGLVDAFDGRLQLDLDQSPKGFVIDFRFIAGSKAIELTLPQLKDRLVISANDDSVYGESLSKPGEWNRIEATFQPGVLEFLMNGSRHSVKLDAATESFSISASGPIDVANIYMR